ncbi:bifunctional UDP-N-acetylglucosamine pyrophosphorylase / Glucosamine-1-phosphate N-acetyltransferase [Caloranaerobacter azorensis DSM 13643]|uniref:Bifunctional protein GlmU n=1 Tax=Caloranaerobacter azorensis DSM 13643 TaxID=1121264 RepID=A0A1M5SXG6_9FIRM|nr:bifunctional UDP-N-acetylglucosamine diphosphorylase/glucosamine-1-phosphate N-acetyltransferase GlmU [Caloranaerobacter azorensis]SHH42928.1 bifunctional UDP-N-acetylglucosamine pyrophosphorylase / Glucosamine-1-phosphate N-acetyltransferase [Caloranaerobacter azorensis DSM 13643]
MIISIILAAGEGTRMKSKLPKVLHQVCGKPMLSHVIEASKGAGIKENIVIVGHGKEKVKDTIKEEGVVFVEQPIGEKVPYGTGFAVMQAEDLIKDDNYVIILYGDTPLITSKTITDLIDYHRENSNNATVLTAEFDNPTGYGRIIRDDKGNIIGIVEEKDATIEQKRIREINSGIYCFDGKYLKMALHNLNSNNAQNEYYITDSIKILNEKGLKVGGYKLNDNTEIFGVNSRVQLAEADRIMRRRINEKLMLSGVTILDPDNTYIGKDVQIGRDTIVYPGVFLEGNTKIGEDCIIGSNSRIINSNIGSRVVVQSSTIIDSEVGENTTIGPYAYLRPNSKIGKSVKIGDFVEVKNSVIGDNSKASHLAYIGDADVGRNVNIGCGVVFVNYDGVNKHRTIVEDNAFIGSNSNLVAPVIVREKGYVAAGSTITEEVGKGTLSIARARQVNKEGWIERKFNKNKE